jgi:hypothetical protein
VKQGAETVRDKFMRVVQIYVLRLIFRSGCRRQWQADKIEKERCNMLTENENSD